MSTETNQTNLHHLHETIPAQNPQNLLNINMANVSKLTATNYLMWSLQVRALLDGYGFVGHLDGSSVVPDPTLTVNEEVSVNLPTPFGSVKIN